MNRPHFPTLAESVGRTPLVRLQRLPVPDAGLVLAKLEGANPAGSVKDRPAFAMVREAVASGRLTAGAGLIEATSGNTGIALAAASAASGHPITLVLPAGSGSERTSLMRAYGATVIETEESGGMELARDTAEEIARRDGAVRLDQFANPANPDSHTETTGPELWEQTAGTITHLVSAMGTTGTITGTSRHLKQHNPDIRIIGVQPEEGERIPGIRTWPPEYLPAISDPTAVDEIRHVTRAEAQATTIDLARREGLLLGISSGGAATIALRVAAENPEATVVFIAPDRGDRYLSSGLFD